MDESQWLASADPVAMLEFLRHGPRAADHEGRDGGRHWLGRGDRPDPSDRKLRLFACACTGQVWHLLTDPRSRRGVEVAERYADGGATEQERHDARHAAVRLALGHLDGPLAALAQATCYRGETLARGLSDALRLDHGIPPAALADLLREVIGNPFIGITELDGAGQINHPWASPISQTDIVFDWDWKSPTVLSLAQAAYEDRLLPSGTLDPDRLAVLADALEDAGCDCTEILCHLRGQIFTPRDVPVGIQPPAGPHVRGCWCLDLLLGKS